ncbi:MAG: hypothetical protein IKL77_00215, partial [Clostridia bacterium]|nr:hypothetical protein [Clostridia bacterium]
TGFVEGTTHVSTGDRIKQGDHRRDKRNCFFYSNEYCKHFARKCCGSSHCDHYNDGIMVNIIEESYPNMHTHRKRLISFISRLKNEIDYRSVEGQYICQSIFNKYGLSRKNFDEADRQIQIFEEKKIILIKEIDTYNSNLKNKCILLSLFIITAPFCYMYYKNNFRESHKEIETLKNKLIDDEFQKKVSQCKKELQAYIQASKGALKNCVLDKNEHFFSRAIYEYKNKNYARFCEMILKSIMDIKNLNAVLFLIKVFKTDVLFKKYKSSRLILLLYASYQGHKESSKVLEKIIMKQNDQSKIGIC